MTLPEPQRDDENPGLGPMIFIILSTAFLLLLLLVNFQS